MWKSTPASIGGRGSSTTASGGACAASRPQKQIGIAMSRMILAKFILVRLILRWARRKRTAICPIVCHTIGHIAVLLRSEEHTSELQSHLNLVCRLLLE